MKCASGILPGLSEIKSGVGKRLVWKQTETRRGSTLVVTMHGQYCPFYITCFLCSVSGCF